MEGSMKDELTSRQQEVYDFLLGFWQARGYPPSIREVASHFEFRSTRAVVDHLGALERKGWIRRTRERSRAIEFPNARGDQSPVGQRLEVLEVPVVGRIAAGAPILAVENIVEEIALDRSWVRGPKPFLLQVAGDSMRDAGILDRDFVLVDGAPRADDGDIVAALLDEEATVKRLQHRRGEVWLEPANPAYEPIPVRGDRPFQIVGKVIGVFRKL
jgi:repressor LexA